MYVYKKPEHEHGFGNLLIHLSMLKGPELVVDGKQFSVNCDLLHDSVYGYELSNCIHLDGFTRVSYEGVQPITNVVLNHHIFNIFHKRIRNIVRPTEHMKKLLAEHAPIMEGVKVGMCIRRGSCAPDSVQYKGELGDRPYQYFTNDSGLAKFEEIIKSNPGPVYVTSDSPMTKNYLRDKYGSKVRMVDTVYTFTGTQDQTENQTIKNLQDVYLTWFLLSKCKVIFNTMAANKLRSTFGYTAAVYGGGQCYDVEN